MLEERHHRRQVLAHVADRLVERHPPHALDDGPMAEPDAEREAAAGDLVHGQRLLGQHHRVARERRHHTGAELDSGNLAGDHRQGGQRIVTEDLRHPERREPCGLDRLRLLHIRSTVPSLTVPLKIPMRIDPTVLGR